MGNTSIMERSRIILLSLLYLMSIWIAPAQCGSCASDSAQYFSDLSSTPPKKYASDMFDALGRRPSGLASFNAEWLGAYDQCVQTEYVEPNGEIGFTGAYCIVYLPPFYDDYQWPKYGTCLPSSCSSENETLEFASTVINLQEWPAEFPKVNITPVAVSCVTKQPYSGGDIFAIVVCCILAILVITGTALDGWAIRMAAKEREAAVAAAVAAEPGLTTTDAMLGGPIEEENKTSCRVVLREITKSFSWISNGSRLFDSKIRPGTLPSLNGIRVLSTYWIVLGHTYFVTHDKYDNVYDNFRLFGQFGYIGIHSSGLMVDSFLFLSAFLIIFLSLKELDKTSGKKSWILFYLYRWWRLTPVYMFVIMLTATLYMHLPQGPRFSYVLQQVHDCRAAWFANLFYINNIWSPASCVGWSWYLALDMQYFILTPLYIVLFRKKPKIAVALVSIFAILSIAVTGVASRMTNSLPINILYSPPGYANTYSVWFYFHPPYRFAPYAVGILTAYFLYSRQMKLTMPKWAVVLGWCLAIAVNMACAYSLYPFDSNPGNVIDLNLSAFFTSMHRFAFAVSIAWIAVACIPGNGGYISSMLSWPVWQPLGRLSYLVYLLHPLVILYQQGVTRVPTHLDTWSMVHSFLAYICVTHAVAVVLTLTVEMPMLRLEKVFLGLFGWTGRGTPSKASPSPEVPSPEANSSSPTRETTDTELPNNHLDGSTTSQVEATESL